MTTATAERTDAQRFDMPSGHSIFYFPAGHHYCRFAPDEHKSGQCFNACRGRVAGASSVAKNDGSSDDGLLNHYERTACRAVATLASPGLAGQSVEAIVSQLSWLADGDSVLGAISAAKLTARADMQRKADAGTAAHNVLEALSEGVTPPFASGHELAVVSWWKKVRPTPVAVEQVVYDHEHGWAGRFDLQYGTDSTTLLDLKTGSVRRPAVIQTNLYAIGCRVAGLRAPDRLAILDTKDDGSWAEVEVPINADWAYSALKTHFNGKEIDRALRQAYKVARRG